MVIEIMLEMLSEAVVFIIENALLGVFALFKMITSGNRETIAGLIIVVIIAGGSAIVSLEAPRLYEEANKSKKKSRRKTKKKSSGGKKTNQGKKAMQKDKPVQKKKSTQRKKTNSYKPRNTKSNAVRINTKKEIVTPGAKKSRKKKAYNKY